MMRAWERNIRKVTPYTPGEQPKKERMIKLNTNENPYPPSPQVAAALAEADAGMLRMYPDPAAEELVRAIAERYGLGPGQVFVGVGSDDVLAMIFLTFFNSGRPVLFPDVTYSFYDVWAEMLRIPYEQIPLDEEWRIRPQDYRKENGGVVFPNPNAPTGEEMPLAQIEGIVRDNPEVIVVVDEAYIDFGGESALPLIDRYDNLLVVQTFSKSRSMAGSRIGYAMGSEPLIRYLNDVKYSFNSYTMDRITIALGVAAVRDEEYFRDTVARIIRTREWVKRELAELGFEFGDSQSNFLFVTHPRVQALQLFEDLKAADIYVRYFRRPQRISNYLRITVGTDEEMRVLVDFLRQYLEEGKGC